MFDTLLEISLTTSLIIAFLLIFMPFLSKRYSSKWRYLIWLFVVIRLLIPINLNLLQSPLTLATANGQIEMQLSAIIPDTIVVMPTNNISLIGVQPSIPTQDILLIIWAIGAIAFLFWHLSAYSIFCRSVRRFGKQVDCETQKVFNCIKSELKIKKDIKLILYKEVSSPILLGFFSSCVLLPNTDFNKADLEAIFTHELIHCSRRDLWYKLMILLAQSVHWFNPLVHMMAYAANRDIEISCDEEVIKNTDAAFRRQYAESMLSVMQKSLHPKTMLSTNFYGGEKVMKQRFTSIFDMKVKKEGVMLFAIVLVATLMAGMLVSCATATDGTNTPPPSSSENKTTKDTTQVGKTNNVVVSIEKSDKFSEEEINDAINCVNKKFKDFEGCNLTKLWYDEEKSNNFIEGYLKNGNGSVNGVKAENVIVLLSNFDVDSSGGDGSLNPNSTYSNWNWILIRDNKTGNWKVDDCGY